ncbi:MAG: SIMPL domain-containing protein [Chloroflexia bacterium]|nr:SIMPL domain-containing protein [Chloroflexia bacterium]
MIRLNILESQNGFSLLSSITITAVISTIVIILFIGTILQNNVVIREVKKKKLELLCKSAVELAKLDSLNKFNKPFHIEIDNEKILVIKSNNGLYLEINAFAKIGNDSVSLRSILGGSNVVYFKEAVTLSEANSKIDKRISDFLSALLKMGISKDDIYIDMTTQTLISDYKVTGNYAEQFISGFEQKKNVVIKFENIKQLDQMVVIASDYGIYDLAKVDYIVLDNNKIYTELFQVAVNVINGKKELYTKATNVKLQTGSQIYGESFYSFFPAETI